MVEVTIDLTEDEFKELNMAFPQSMQSAKVGERAIALVRIYFKKKYPGCTFPVPQRGADLKVQHNLGSEQLEVKGTEASDIAWAKIKVSSTQSHDLLQGGMPLYRVASVYGRHPRIFIMTVSTDFEMVPEPRWSLRPRRNK